MNELENRVASPNPEMFLIRVFRSLAWILALFFSLMTFPSGIPWMVLAWVIVALFRGFSAKSMWVPLLVCGTILMVKRPGFTWSSAILLFSLLVAIIIDFRSRRLIRAFNSARTSKLAIVLLASWCAFATMRFQAANISQVVQPDERPVACVGDSLTDYGYPAELAKLISVPVKDFGFNGYTTDDGIKLLPNVLACDPQVVVLELGGHDYNQGKPRNETRENLEQLIEAFRENNTQVVLVEVPHGFVSDMYDGLERELAAKYDLQLVSDSIVRSFVLNSPIMPPGIWLGKGQHLSSDGLHPNARGNKRFAKVVALALQKVFGNSVLKSQTQRNN